MQATAQHKPNLDLIQRTPKRLTATLPWQVVENLQLRADTEGRSLSNLVAYLLEANC